jgi:FkbM family methyltransferase
MRNYSQNDEQAHILRYFGDYVGTFLSLGENDGETFSNVRALALLGWCGVMVEPSPRAFQRLKTLYAENKKGCFYLHPCAIGTVNGPITLHESGELVKQNDVALVSTVVEEEKKRFSKVVTYEPVTVEMYRWKTFRNRLKIKTFDMVSIDIEGMDLDVIEQMDLTDTKLVCIEHNGNQDMKQVLQTEVCTGMNLLYESPENLIFAR